MRAWKEIFHANGDQKKAGIAILISDKIDFEIKAVKETKMTLHNDQRINPKAKWLPGEALQIAVKIREVKSKGE